VTDAAITLRVPLKWVHKPGPAHCPVHGQMFVEIPPDANDAAIQL
jgi:hypothetical protein